MTKPAQSVEFREPEWLARMETVLEVLNEGVVIADDRPRILFANSRVVEMIGIPAVELIGFAPSNFYSSQEWDFVAKQDEDKRRDKSDSQGVLKIISIARTRKVFPWFAVRLCFARIPCALKMVRFTAAMAASSRSSLHPRTPRFCPCPVLPPERRERCTRAIWGNPELYTSFRRTRRMPKAIRRAGISRRMGMRTKRRNCQGTLMDC